MLPLLTWDYFETRYDIVDADGNLEENCAAALEMIDMFGYFAYATRKEL